MYNGNELSVKVWTLKLIDTQIGWLDAVRGQGLSAGPAKLLVVYTKFSPLAQQG
jgi:hypothetical protein